MKSLPTQENDRGIAIAATKVGKIADFRPTDDSDVPAQADREDLEVGDLHGRVRDLHRILEGEEVRPTLVADPGKIFMVTCRHTGT